MTDLSTLLFTAARGARLQKYDTFDLKWEKVELWEALWNMELNYSVRIHPDDEHLMWGPLSRQYYEAALFGVVSSMYDPAMKVDGVKCDIDMEEWDRHYADAEEPTRRMILLTIAYALRDEGM